MKQLDFQTAFKYPFNDWQRMFYVLWAFLPIFGWLALFGYQVRIVKSWVKGDFKQLPEMTFGSDMKLGFNMFIKIIPLMGAFWLVSLLLTVTTAGLGSFAVIFISLFVFPLLVINFLVKETIESSFELDVVKPVFKNFEDYVIVLLKTLGLAVVWGILFVVLVGIPGSVFTKNIFIADFYRRKVKK